MSDILTSLWPLFFLILVGYAMQRARFPGEEFWPGAERLNYYILFPALLFSSLVSAPLDHPALPRLLAAVMLALGIATAGLLIARWCRKWPAARFGVLLQGALRFNTYLGLAAVGGLYGQAGMPFAAAILAILIPSVNLLSILALSVDSNRRPSALILPVAKNPLIIACIGGVMVNLAGIELRWGAEKLLPMLASASLPLGLLSVGAALRPKELHGQYGTMIGNSLFRLLVMPGIAFLSASSLALPALETGILVLFFALPTAPTSYVLARQLGGDSHLMAGIITFQTLFSAISLILVMAVVA